jgi:ketosteroid isomerase-like protein
MSRTNEEALREGYEHFNRTGRPDLSKFHPDAEFDATGRIFDRAMYRGHREIGEYFDQLDDVWERQSLEPEEFVELGDKVVVSVTITTVGRGSGVETKASAAHLWTLRDDKVVRLQIFQTRGDALEAAGLAE